MKAGITRMVAVTNDIHSKQSLELAEPYSRFIFALILRDSTGIFSINFCHCHLKIHVLFFEIRRTEDKFAMGGHVT
ncbi:hypothetical protein P5673_014278 [Acropora cervicornis]|uniref:Uncharacterized protein n=1 Tax=Acropora cervicornis TaxID=6130 RepID=A0AAD9V620_ACRCE|nr:hypothetical protein P5673_014278 [Acropora cervicornis]